MIRIIVISLLAILFVLNLFFRVRVMRQLRKLNGSNVQVGLKDLLSKDTMENKIIPKFPNHADELVDISNSMRLFVKFALGILALLLVLMVYAKTNDIL